MKYEMHSVSFPSKGYLCTGTPNGRYVRYSVSIGLTYAIYTFYLPQAISVLALKGLATMWTLAIRRRIMYGII
jgi:hypothetical protein